MQICPICNKPMVLRMVNNQKVYVCPEHSSMKNILIDIAQETNNEMSKYFQKDQKPDCKPQ